MYSAVGGREVGRASDPCGPGRSGRPSLGYYGAATCGGGVKPRRYLPRRRGCRGPTLPEAGIHGTGERGAGCRSPAAGDAPRSGPQPPPSSPPAGRANSGFCRASLAPSSAAENPSGGGSLPRSPGKSGGGRQGSPSGQGEAARASLPALGPVSAAPNLDPSVQSPPPIFSPQNAQTTTR
jgi:hypothetical protein